MDLSSALFPSTRPVISTLLIASLLPAGAYVSESQPRELVHQPISSGFQSWAPVLNGIATKTARSFQTTRKWWPSLPDRRRELYRLARNQFEDALVPTRPTSPSEDGALLAALRLYRVRKVPDDFSALQEFLAGVPDSGWRLSLLINIGHAYYHYGYFSQALSAFEDAWKEGRYLTEPSSKALADRAIGELIRMHARIGHADVLSDLLNEINDRPVSGPATEAVSGGREGLWTMRNNPGVAYLCGPMALRNLFLSEGVPPANLAYLDSVRSSVCKRALISLSGAKLKTFASAFHRL